MGQGGGGQGVPPPRLPRGCPWLPPRPQLLLPGPDYHGRPRRPTGLRGAERSPPPTSAGPRLPPQGLPGLRCGGPRPSGVDSLQAPPLPRLLLRAAAPLQAPAPPQPPLRLPGTLWPRPPPPPRVKEAPVCGRCGCPARGRARYPVEGEPGSAQVAWLPVGITAYPIPGAQSPRRWPPLVGPSPRQAAASSGLLLPPSWRRQVLGHPCGSRALTRPSFPPARESSPFHPRTLLPNGRLGLAAPAAGRACRPGQLALLSPTTQWLHPSPAPQKVGPSSLVIFPGALYWPKTYCSHIPKSYEAFLLQPC